MADLRERSWTWVAFAVGDGVRRGTWKASMIEEDHATTGDPMRHGRNGRFGEERTQCVQLDVAMPQGIVERGPTPLHSETEFGGRVRAWGLSHGIDELQQRSGALGEGLISLVAELRQTVECFHTRPFARSSAVSRPITLHSSWYSTAEQQSDRPLQRCSAWRKTTSSCRSRVKRRTNVGGSVWPDRGVRS